MKKCIKCYRNKLEISVTSITYSRPGSLIQVKVEGIPAKICQVCGEAYLSDVVAQQIFDIVDPLLKVGQTMRQEMILPTPLVDIRYPPLSPSRLKQAIMA